MRMSVQCRAVAIIDMVEVSLPSLQEGKNGQVAQPGFKTLYYRGYKYFGVQSTTRYGDTAVVYHLSIYQLSSISFSFQDLNLSEWL